MNKNQSLDMFINESGLKYAPYWNRVEKFLSKPDFMLNMGELLDLAMGESYVRLCYALQCFMDMEFATGLTSAVQVKVIDLAVSSDDMTEEELFEACQDTAHSVVAKSGCFPPEEADCYRAIGGFMDDYLKSFLRLKKGGDLFADFLFSDHIFTEELEDEGNICALLNFIAALGPNLFLEKDK